MPLPPSVLRLDEFTNRADMAEGVQNLSVADLESMSITDISALESNALKDLLNDAIRNRLAQHLGGTYTSAPKMTLAELSFAESA
jgi:hypothetical protein